MTAVSKVVGKLTKDEAEAQKRLFRERVVMFAWPAKIEHVEVELPSNAPRQVVVQEDGTEVDTTPPPQVMVVELRQPTMDQRSKILAASGFLADDPTKRDMGQMMVQAILECAYFPGTDVKLVDTIDVPRMKASLAGGWADKLGQVALKLMNVDAPAAAKKSEMTPSSNSSV